MPIDASFNTQQRTPIETEFIVAGRVSQHNQLTGRGEPDCHPKSAITGLTDDLNNLEGEITAEEIARQLADKNLQDALDGKQDIISDLSDIRSGAELGATAIQPNDNISELVNDVGYITSSDLPTVGNATLTIQKNGTAVDTFTANATVDKTINITVPTQASDVGALPDSTKYGASLSLTINSSTYVITGQLKDQDGNNLGSAQTIDLPLESVVVSGSYDSATKEVVLTLQGGSTVRFSVADLVSGLQSEITSSNKLDADLVDDSNSTNKFVTASDKTTWNGKQDALVSGTNIKTINNTSILGSGNIDTKELPTQTGNSGKFLTTNGNSTSWASVSIPTVNNPTITITQGGTIKGTFTLNQSSNETIALDAGGGSSLPSQTGNAGKFLTTDGTDASWANVNPVVIRRFS